MICVGRPYQQVNFQILGAVGGAFTLREYICKIGTTPLVQAISHKIDILIISVRLFLVMVGEELNC